MKKEFTEKTYNEITHEHFEKELSKKEFNLSEKKKELKRIDKYYGRKLDRLCEQSLGRSKEARQIKKEWIEKAVPLENDIFKEEKKFSK